MSEAAVNLKVVVTERPMIRFIKIVTSFMLLHLKLSLR
jgi:hypothetical protein